MIAVLLILIPLLTGLTAFFFKNEKLVELDNKKIRILDYDRMCVISYKG